MNIALPKNFNFSECLWFLDRGFDECMHQVADGKVRKLFEIENQKVLVEVSYKDEFLKVETLCGELKDEKKLKEIISDWFDLERDLSPFYDLLKQDADIAFLSEKYAGLRLMAIPDIFEVMCWSIIGQQINLTFAYKIKRALVEHYGEFVEYENQKYYLFPKPEILKNADVELLKEMKFSRQKIDYMCNLAHSFANGDISFEKVKAKNSHQEMLEFLVSFRGIGEWTAQYTLMKCLKNSEAIPYGDAGINQALFGLKNIAKKENRSQLEAIFAQYPGWEAYLVFYLWRWLSGNNNFLTQPTEK
jgi:DNA-3-methyladenine glycosylase II